MKLIQTLYFNKSIDPFKHSFGWCSPEYHLMGWVLSCLQLNKVYGDVDLYCNSEVATLFRDQIGLPYTNYFVTHNDLDIINEQLWALPKVFTYSLQTSPFLHLDGDVFLFKQLPANLLNSDLVAQNMEVATEYYTSAQDKLMAYFTYFPSCVEKDFKLTEPIKAVNAGILGGNDLSFFKEYSKQAFEYVYYNRDHLLNIVPDRFNVFFEQHLFYCLAKEKKIRIDFLFSDTIKDNQYENLSDFQETPFNKTYLHLLGHYKKDRYTCMKMAEKLRNLYPEFYYRIITLCNKHQISLSNKVYRDNKSFTATDFIHFSREAKLIYNTNTHKAKEKIEEKNESVTIKDIKMLQDFINQISENSKYYTIKNQIQKDFEKFTSNIKKHAEQNIKFTSTYLYGRDIEEAKWYSDLFEDEKEIRNKIISKCTEIQIIESAFDWAGLINKNNRVAVRYYEELELVEGCFYNLLIPEVTINEFSFYDLDEMEKIILENISDPLSIQDLQTKMHEYVDDDVLRNHLGEYYNLILVFVKALVLKKAIRPNAT